MPTLRNLNATVKLAVGLALAALLALAGWYVFLRPQEAAQQTATAKTEAVSQRAQTEAAKDTVRIVVDRNDAATRIIETTKENTRVIMATPGAEAPLAGELHAAGLRALCLHDNVRDVSCADVLHGPAGVDQVGTADAPRPSPEQ